jgi:hypothetical protein
MMQSESRPDFKNRVLVIDEEEALRQYPERMARFLSMMGQPLPIPPALCEDDWCLPRPTVLAERDSYLLLRDELYYARRDPNYERLVRLLKGKELPKNDAVARAAGSSDVFAPRQTKRRLRRPRGRAINKHS